MAAPYKLGDFCRYLATQRDSIRGVYREIEEVQYQFNELYRQNTKAWQAAISKTVPLLIGDEPLPPALAHNLLKVTDEERAKLAKEIAELTGLIAARRSEADQAIAAAQAEVNNLRQMNPQLDAQEEELKARDTTIQQAIQELGTAIKHTGLLSGFFQRRRLKREREEQRLALAECTKQLRQVRENWKEEKKRCQDDQVRLQQEWEAASLEAAQSQSRLDYLQSNQEKLSRQNGAGRFLAELQETPDAPEPLRQTLAGMVELNRVKAEYEEGLRTVAEALGLLKGMSEGMERFLQSARKVYEEQTQHSLPELRIKLGAEVTNLHALWPQFQAQVKDEKELGTHPAEFSRRVQAIIQSHLGDQAIATMFESMGEALNQATKAWG